MFVGESTSYEEVTEEEEGEFTFYSLGIQPFEDLVVRWGEFIGTYKAKAMEMKEILRDYVINAKDNDLIIRLRKTKDAFGERVES